MTRHSTIDPAVMVDRPGPAPVLSPRWRGGAAALAILALLSGCSHGPAAPPIVTHSLPASTLFRVGPQSPATRYSESAASGHDRSGGGNLLDSAALIDRVVARRRKEEESRNLNLAATRTRDAFPTGGEPKRRHRGHATASNRVEEGPMPVGAVAVDPCESMPAGATRGKGRSRKESTKAACQLALRNPVGPPDPRTLPRAWVRRGDAWEGVRSGLVLAGVQHERLEAQLGYLRQRPGSVEFLMAQAEPYLQYLLGEIRRQGLPTDLILVPMVESAFRTTALSPKQAAGLWQFIPSTGQQYGLQLSDAYDGRYDTHPATQAALKYLRHLQGLFKGDWLLALAAYNAGEGAVQRAIQANLLAGGAGSFWELSLPEETQNYVVRILALAKVVADPASQGFKPRKAVLSRSTLARVEARPDVHISDLIASSGIDANDFYRLNPAFKPDVDPPAQPHHFLLPLEKAEILMAANLPGAKVHAPRKVVVQKGDTLTLLARKHGVPELKLAEWNGLPPRASLKVGQEILVQGV